MAQSRNSIKVVSVLGRVSFVRPCWRVRVEMSSAERENTRARDNGGKDGMQSGTACLVTRYLALHTASLGNSCTCPLYKYVRSNME